MPGEQTSRSKWMALVGVCLGVLMFTLDGSVVNIAVPSLLKAFNCTLTDVEGIITGYLFVIVILLLPVASVARRVGEKRIYLTGLAVFSLGSLLCGFSSKVEWLTIFRLVQGLGAVCLAALMSSIVIKIFPKEQLGRALGIVTASATLGASLGPSIGGFLIYAAGWRSIFLINLPIGLVAFTLIACSLPRDVPPAGPAKKITMGMRLALFRNSALSIGLLGRFLAMAGNAAYLFLTPLMLEVALKYTTYTAGLLLAVAPILTGALSPVFGSLADKYGVSRFTIAGVATMIVALLIMSTFAVPMNGWEFIARVVLWGVGLGIFNAPNNARTMNSVSPEKSGTASALFSMAIILGQMAGVMVAGYLFHRMAFGGVAAGNIHLLAPELIASSVGRTLLCFAIPVAGLLGVIVWQTWTEGRRAKAS